MPLSKNNVVDARALAILASFVSKKSLLVGYVLALTR